MKRLVVVAGGENNNITNITNTSRKFPPSVSSALELGKAAVMQDALASRTRARRKTEDLDPIHTKSFLRQTSSSSQKMNHHINGDSVGGSGGSRGGGGEHKRRTDAAGPTKASGAGSGGFRRAAAASQGTREGKQSQVFERLAKVDSNKSSSNSGRGGGRGHHQQEAQKIKRAVGGHDSFSRTSSTQSRRKHVSPTHSSCSSVAVEEEESDSFTEKQEQENMPETTDKDRDDFSPPPPLPPPSVSSSISTTSPVSSHPTTTSPPSHTTTTTKSPDAASSHSKSPKLKTKPQKYSTTTSTKVEGKKNTTDGGSRGVKGRRSTRSTPEQREEATGEVASRSEVLERVRARVGDGRTQEAGEVRDADKDVCEADVADEEKEFYKISVKTRLVTYDNNTLVIRNTSKREDMCEEETEEEETEDVGDGEEGSDSSTTTTPSHHHHQQQPQQPTTNLNTDLQTSSGEEVVGTAVGGPSGDVECGSSPSSHTSSINPPHHHQRQEGALGGSGRESGRVVADVRRRLTLLVNRGRDFLSEFYSATQHRLEQYTRPDHTKGRSDSGGYYSLPQPLVEANPLWSQEREILRRGYGAYPSMQVPLFRPVQYGRGGGDQGEIRQWGRDVASLRPQQHADTENKAEHDRGMPTRQATEDDRTEEHSVGLNRDTGGEAEHEGCSTIIVDEEWIKKNILCTCQCRRREGEERKGRTEQDGGGVDRSSRSRRGGLYDCVAVEGSSSSSSSMGELDDDGTVNITSMKTNTISNNKNNKKPSAAIPRESQNNSNNNSSSKEVKEESDGEETEKKKIKEPSIQVREESVGKEEEKEKVRKKNDGEEEEKVKEESEEIKEEKEEDLCYCSCHEGEEGRGAVLPHHLPQEVQDLLDADHARMWWTITGNFGNILPIDWSKTYTRQQYLPVLNLNQMKEGSSSEDEGVEESSPSTDSMNDPPTRPCPPHLYADKLRSMSVGALNETLMELELVVRQYSETLITQLALRDELEYEKELKNSFISLLLQVQNKRRNFNVEKKKQKKVGPNGTDPKYLTTVIPYDVGHGPPLNTTLQILIKILTAINEDSPTVPTLLTDYILKALQISKCCVPHECCAVARPAKPAGVVWETRQGRGGLVPPHPSHHSPTPRDETFHTPS